MSFDFTEDKNTITIYIYKKSLKEGEFKPSLIADKLRITDLFAINLYKPAKKILRISDYKFRYEILIEKIESELWGGVSGPSNVYIQRKDINIEIEEKDDKELSLNELFSKIYSQSGDDVKKAMEKSLYESGGTVLSTNWDEVKSKKVEPKK